MFNFLITPLFCALFIFLFFRQDRLDKRAAARRHDQGNLHVLQEMKKFLDERNQDTTFLDTSIKDLVEKLKQ